MTRDELHDRFIREGAFPGTPKGRGLITVCPERDEAFEF